MAQQPDVPAAAQPSLQEPALLTEDEADDLLYCARTGELEELQTVLAEVLARIKQTDKTTTTTTTTTTMTLAVLRAARDASQNTPLHMAAANGHAAVVGFLLRAADGAGPDAQSFVDAANAFGNTALHWAALNGRLAVVRQLVEGADGGVRAAVALANDKNYIPLDLASLHGHDAVAAYFMTEAEGRAAKSAQAEEEETKTESKTTKDKEDGKASALSTATAALALDGP